MAKNRSKNVNKPTRYWLSFDLGLRGNYEDLYVWLDQMGAKECGESVATFRATKSRNDIARELSSLLDPDKARVYIIDRARGGKFILGRRKRAPWSGFALGIEEVEEEQ